MVYYEDIRLRYYTSCLSYAFCIDEYNSIGKGLRFAIDRPLDRLGTVIREARIKTGLTQRGLAKKLGISPRHIMHIESNHRTAVSGAIIITGLWVFLVIASNCNHSTVLLYALLNTPTGWAYIPISNSAGYLNSANLLFTVFSPISFAIGVKIHEPRDFN